MEPGELSDRSAEEPDIYQCHSLAKEALQIGDSDVAFQALVHAFWCMNDPMRFVSDSQYFKTSSIEYKHNAKGIEIIRALEELLDMKHDGDLLLSTEILRECSRFDECIILAETFDGSELESLANPIKELAEKRISIVRPYSLM